MNQFLEISVPEFDKTLNHLKEEFQSLRTGRANPALIENILVEAYGTRTPIRQLANITVSDARTIVISPWDKTILKEIEKGITYADIGLNPTSTSEGVIINLPMMTEDNRKDLVKIVGQKAEKCRIVARGIRDTVKEEIMTAEKNKEIAEDERYKAIKELDEYIQVFNTRVKTLAEGREKEIMTI